MADDTRFALTSADRLNPLWLRLKEHLENQLREAQAKLEGDQSETQTAHWRGRIKVLRGFIALGNDEPPFDG